MQMLPQLRLLVSSCERAGGGGRWIASAGTAPGAVHGPHTRLHLCLLNLSSPGAARLTDAALPELAHMSIWYEWTLGALHST